MDDGDEGKICMIPYSYHYPFRPSHPDRALRQSPPLVVSQFREFSISSKASIFQNTQGWGGKACAEIERICPIGDCGRIHGPLCKIGSKNQVFQRARCEHQMPKIDEGKKEKKGNKPMELGDQGKSVN